MLGVPLHNFVILQWRVMVVRRILASREYDAYHLRWRDTRIVITETIDGFYEFEVNEQHQKGLNGKRFDVFEVDVLLAIYCAKDVAEAREHFTFERLRAPRPAPTSVRAGHNGNDYATVLTF